MAETLISPGVLSRENDQTLVTQQPVDIGAAIIGPTVLGPVERPTLVSSFSSFQTIFGGALQSASNEFTYLTSIAANQYFQNGGTSLLVTRVVSASATWAPALSNTIQNNNESATAGLIGNIVSGLQADQGSGSAAPATYTNVSVTDTGAGTGIDAKATVTTSNSNGHLIATSDDLLGEVQAGTTATKMSDATYTDVVLTQGSSVLGKAKITVSGNAVVSPVDVTATGSGYTAGNITIAAGALGTGMFVAGAGPTPTGTGASYGNTLSSGAITITSGMVSGGGEGGTINFTTNAAGAIVSCVLAIGAGKDYTDSSVITVPEATLQASSLDGGGTGNAIVTLTSTNVQNSAEVTVAILDANILTEISSVVITEDGSGYASSDTVTIAAGDIGNPAVAPTFILTDAMIENDTAFVLETLSEGVIMNNTFPLGSDTGGTELTGGALVSGSVDNVRWEIASANSASGVFSLLIRRGNDDTNNKVVLEQYNNISLDPFSPNFISRAIGDVKTTLVTEGADTYLQESGSYPNISNYVRVKSVNAATPNYFQNNGVAKDEFTGSLPQLGSGSFDGAGGSNIPSNRRALFYQDINNSDAQGLLGADYTNAINLLSDADNYVYNVITVPGLNYQDHSTQINSIMNNVIARGDSMAVVDLVRYNQSIATVTTQASGIDNSYTATYWPWLQTVDPNSGQLVFIPASTFIPGIYAFTDASSDPWFAPAGITRGGMGQVVRAERRLTSRNRDTLYEANVNPIATFPATGVVVFGQKTLQKAASALDRVNVRRLLITLKSFISQIADNLVFEQNTIATRQNFLTQVNPYLESVQQRQGLFAFKVVMDESNNTPDVIDRNELIGQIFLQPTRTAEFIILDFNVLPTGATFPA